MKLFPITSAKEKPFSAHCANCGRIIQTDRDDEARADTEGEAFAAYYCGPCVARINAAKMTEYRFS
jgi:hypothetical protein